MAEPHVVSGLKAKHSEILSEIDRLEAVIAGHRADLLVVEAAIAIVAGGTAVSGPSRPAMRKRLFERGESGRLVYATLRRVDRPVSTQEIVGLIASDKGHDTTDLVAMSGVMHRVGKTLAKFRQRGDVLGERQGNMTWWRLP